MAVTITDQAMRGTRTPHTAAAAIDGGWSVTWLPGRTLNRNQAITAMTLAEHAGRGAACQHVGTWAGELGLTAAAAIAMASADGADVHTHSTQAVCPPPPRARCLTQGA